MGSDNNKGQATDWTQGIRALGWCAQKDALGGSRYRIVITDLLMLPRSVEKLELLQASPETYARSLSEAAIIGLNNYSSQVVQLLTPKEFATIGAIIARLLPESREGLFDALPDAAEIELIERPSVAKAPNPIDEDHDPIEIGDDDPYLQAVRHSIEEDEMGGVLFVGVPATGKTWYARQVARKLTSDNRQRIREIQFHPSYQYEDFVEGYVPDAQAGFRLAPKHLLEMIEEANKTDEPVVMIIDEFSRTDPARVLGEALTYMDGPMRGVPFYLPSGRKIAIPKNLVFLATMNPDDRSVDDIDDAMDRRWGKVTLEPSADKVREFLKKNGADGAFIAATIQFFQTVQKHAPLGHALFRRVKDAPSLTRLWDTQLKYQMHKRFRFDPAGLTEIETLWAECKAALQPTAPKTGPGAAAESEQIAAE
ncbi:AAA family ATPase [Sphingopyxis sp.]|uniref:AAA family ATPase n=1 Tax=Sphingopyxis sp. TaxID=1908224 RepID=UPI0026070D28|nr:AAA family ATPase [Sphingopyxis sp.]MCW0196820.1 AAA family ATPase [Sphingopyxis sp.]